MIQCYCGWYLLIDNNQNFHKSIIAMFLLNHNECQKYAKCTKQSSNHILISLSMLTVNKPKELKTFETLLLWESRLTRNDKLWWSSGRVQILAWRLGDTVFRVNWSLPDDPGELTENVRSIISHDHKNQRGPVLQPVINLVVPLNLRHSVVFI